MDSTVNRVVVADNPDSGGYYEFTEHKNKKLVVVNANELHVWYNGSHYIGEGTPESVKKGDVLYYPRGLAGDGSPIVTEVVGFEDSGSEYDQVMLDLGGQVSEGSILGEPVNMAQLQPPTLLKQQQRYQSSSGY